MAIMCGLSFKFLSNSFNSEILFMKQSAFVYIIEIFPNFFLTAFTVPIFTLLILLTSDWLSEFHHCKLSWYSSHPVYEFARRIFLYLLVCISNHFLTIFPFPRCKLVREYQLIVRFICSLQLGQWFHNLIFIILSRKCIKRGLAAVAVELYLPRRIIFLTSVYDTLTFNKLLNISTQKETRNVATLETFKKKLKTFLFCKLLGDWLSFFTFLSTLHFYLHAAGRLFAVSCYWLLLLLLLLLLVCPPAQSRGREN